MLLWGLHRPVRSWYGSIPEVPLISVAKIYALSHRQHGMRLRAPYVRHPAAKINKVLSRLTCHAAVCTPGSGTASSLRSRRGDTAASAEWNRRFRSQRRPAESRRTKPSSRSASARVLWHTAPLERDTRCSAPRSGGSLRRTRPPVSITTNVSRGVVPWATLHHRSAAAGRLCLVFTACTARRALCRIRRARSVATQRSAVCTPSNLYRAYGHLGGPARSSRRGRV